MSQVAKLAAEDRSDSEIAGRIAGGDVEALRQLMRRHNETLFRTARSILKDDAEAEDAVQDAYLRAYHAIGDFRGESSLSTWLVRIAANEALGRLRKSKRRAEIIVLHDDADATGMTDHRNDIADAAEQPDAAASRAEVRKLIEAKIDKLPDAFRTVFVLRAVEEMTVEETADCLGLPAATVRTRFFRARGLLRESLAREIDLSLETAFGFAGERCDSIVAGVLAKLNSERTPRPTT